MKEVVKKEILKLLDQGIIYPISDNQWVSLVHVVPKKTGLTLVPYEQNKLVPTKYNPNTNDLHGYLMDLLHK